jgi:hypothetical protein
MGLRPVQVLIRLATLPGSGCPARRGTADQIECPELADSTIARSWLRGRLRIRPESLSAESPRPGRDPVRRRCRRVFGVRQSHLGS